MPSPVGHSLIGLALGLAAAVPRGELRTLPARVWSARGALLGSVFVANLPDLDYLPGVLAGDLNRYHHGLTHTLGWCVLMSVAVWLLLRAACPARAPLRVLVWCLALTGSHLLADWLTADNRPPIGILALWPFSDAHFHAPVSLFWPLLKRDYAEIFQWHNVQAIGVEALLCLPLVLLAAWTTTRPPPS
jgi:inner membrane protein